MAPRKKQTAAVAAPRLAAPRAFDAGQSGRRLKAVPTALQAINTQIRRYGRTILARSRYLCANNSYAANAKATFVSALVGTGIKPAPAPSNDFKAAIAEAWADWTDEADADGLTDFYGLQSVVAGEMFEAGEVFVRFRARLPEDGLSVPLQLQILPAEMLDHAYNEILPGMGRIEMGVEFGPIGQRVAYWFWNSHPDSDVIPPEGRVRVRVPAEEVLHLFKPVRAGQIRGIPESAASIVKLALLDQYDDAELERKKLAALFGAFVTKQAEDDVNPLAPDGVNQADASAAWGLEPGAVVELLPGEDVKFAEPADVGGQYEAFQYRTLLAIAAGFGVPYAAMTGDLRATSYGSIRAGLVEFRRRIEALQHQVMVFQFCRPVYERWLNDAVLAGTVKIPAAEMADNPRPFLRAEWRPPRQDWIDPLKDIQAEKLAVDSGFKARSDVIDEQGFDPEAVDARIKADKDREKELGLVFAGPANGTPLPGENKIAAAPDNGAGSSSNSNKGGTQ